MNVLLQGSTVLTTWQKALLESIDTFAVGGRCGFWFEQGSEFPLGMSGRRQIKQRDLSYSALKCMIKRREFDADQRLSGVRNGAIYLEQHVLLQI